VPEHSLPPKEPLTRQAGQSIQSAGSAEPLDRQAQFKQAFLKYGWVLLLILAGAWFLRAHDPNYSSAFMDESVYVVYGRMFLSGHFEAPLDQPLRFSFGWYLWPALAATADRIGGIAGVRELAAILGTLTVLAVFGMARRVFSPATGLASAAIFALLGPAVLACRIATRDSGAICFFAVGLWLYVRAWQKQERSTWLAAAACLFAAFLCKYLVAIFFPFLALLTLMKGRRAVAFCAVPLTLLCGSYYLWHASDLAALLSYARAYGSLKASGGEAWKIYFTGRADFWVLLLLSLGAWRGKPGSPKGAVLLLWLGGALLPLFQWYSRADYDYWKHVNYSLVFLTPLAAEGLLRMVRGLAGRSFKAGGCAAVGVLALALGWNGKAWQIDRFVFWPNVGPMVAFFDGRLTGENRVLIDDSVLRYYLHPQLKQWRMTDPFYFRYGEKTEEAAYSAAIRDGYFDYIALDGGMGDEARRMHAAILPNLRSHYRLAVKMPEANLGQEIEIYERMDPPPARPAAGGPTIEILAPVNDAVVKTNDKGTLLRGTVKGAGTRWYVLVDVYTNRWYPQGGKIFPAEPDGTFSVPIYLGGEGRQQRFHIVRAQLYDERGRPAAVAVQFGIKREE
jgi:hypothetical protein